MCALHAGALRHSGMGCEQAQLLYLDAADSNKDITMYVNSPGGSVTAGMAVFDTMRHVRPDVSTVCVGLAASMGAFLLTAGQQVLHVPSLLTWNLGLDCPSTFAIKCDVAASLDDSHRARWLQGKRYSLPNSRIMIHQPLGGAQGQAADIEIQANEILHHKLVRLWRRHVAGQVLRSCSAYLLGKA